MIKATLMTGLLLMTSPMLLAAETAAPAVEASSLTDGEIKKIDLAQQKITIKHGEITHLGMPPMTMVFKVSEPALLQVAKPGSQIRFRVDKRSEGFVVSQIELAK